MEVWIGERVLFHKSSAKAQSNFKNLSLTTLELKRGVSSGNNWAPTGHTLEHASLKVAESEQEEYAEVRGGAVWDRGSG